MRQFHFAHGLMLVTALALVGVTDAAATGRTVGADVEVGAFRIVFQADGSLMTVRSLRGDYAAVLPVTALTAALEGWDGSTRTLTLNVSVRNTGTTSLFGPLHVVVHGLSHHLITVANPDAGTGKHTWEWTYPGPPLAPGAATESKQWQVVSPRTNNFYFEVRILAGVPLPPGIGGIVTGTDGSAVIVPPDAVPYEALIAVKQVPTADIPPVSDESPIVGAVQVTLQPAESFTDPAPPTAPLGLSIPAPASTPYSNFIVAQQVLIDAIDGQPGLRMQLMPVDTAGLSGTDIVTNGAQFSGLSGDGVFVFLANTGSGFATGVVSEGGGAARAGAVVSNNTNSLVSITNAAGQYTLFVNGGPFTVTAFDPFRGSSGSAAGNIAVSGSTVTANVLMTPLVAPPVTRDGIRNSGFERGDLTSWATTGAAAVRRQFGPTSTGVVILPREGEWMADISTGAGAVANVGSALTQQFIVPAGVRTLRFEFNFISEEFPEFVGSIFDDAFTAVITTPNGQTTVSRVSVNQSGGFNLIGDCFFPGGDGTCGQTGWREGSVDLSAFAGTATPITVGLLFSTNDAGDNIYDTHVLVDNLRFSTLWIDTKLMTGSAATLARVQQEIRQANEILSQAGINVRLRANSTIADPGGLLDLDVTWTASLTAEETSLVAIGRSATATDLNIYYVRSLTGLGAVAIAIGPDDFTDVNLLTNSGVAMTDAAFPETLAHEAGHILISPQTAGNALEHSVGVATNIMNAPRTVPRTVVSRAQSENINRLGAPLLRP